MTEHRGAAVYDHLEDDPRRSEIVLRRIARFFEAGGICDAYERRGDQLVQFYDIANLVADTVPALGRDAVIRRFLFSAKTDWFGRHGPRQTIEELVDLDSFNFPPRSRYSLRPSYLGVEASPEHMRAPRSVWARWLKARGWPVPPELERSGTGSLLPPSALLPAGYDPAWISFDEGVRRVMRAAACDQREAIKGVVAACKDGAVANRYGNTHDAIEPVSWGRAAIRKGYRVEARGYVLIAIVPRPGEIPLPWEMLDPTSPDDAVPRVDRAWSYAPVELHREDLERLWQSPPALEEPRGLLKHAAARLEASGTEERLAGKRRRERWRHQWIAKFVDRQRAARRWASVADLADWCAQSTTTASIEAEASAKELAYRRLTESVQRGEFEREGRSKLLYLDNLVTSDGASPRCRLTREQFEIARDIAAAPPAPSLPITVLNCCWLSADLARQWLEAHGYRSPPYLESVRAAPAGGDGGQHARPMLTVSGELRSAIERTISARGRPGHEVRWKVFCDAVRSEGKATEMRPYTDRHIRRVLTAIEADRTKTN